MNAVGTCRRSPWLALVGVALLASCEPAGRCGGAEEELPSAVAPESSQPEGVGRAEGMPEDAGPPDLGRQELQETREGLRDPSESAREEAVDALEERGGAEAVRQLGRSALEDPSDDVRGRAIEALESLGSEPAIAELGRVVVDGPDEETRIQAADALESLGGPEAARALAEGLRDPSPEVREEVIDALDYVDDPEAIEPLWRAASEEPDEDLREAILDALDSLGEDVEAHRECKEAPTQTPATRHVSLEVAMVRSSWLGVGLICAVLVAASGATALPDYLYGFDMDQLSDPRFTESGMQSVTTCTLATGETPPDGCTGFTEFPPAGQPGAGYAIPGRPFVDFRILPLSDPTVSTDLWADGHSVGPGEEAILLLQEIPEGEYTLLVLSQQATAGTATAFLVTDALGAATGSLGSGAGSTDLLAEQSLAFPVSVDGSGLLEVRFSPLVESGSLPALRGVLNGVLLLPEPGIAWLLLAPLAIGLRRHFLA